MLSVLLAAPASASVVGVQVPQTVAVHVTSAGAVSSPTITLANNTEDTVIVTDLSALFLGDWASSLSLELPEEVELPPNSQAKVTSKVSLKKQLPPQEQTLIGHVSGKTKVKEPEVVDFVISKDNLHMIGYSSSLSSWSIPATFEYEGVHYKTVGIADQVFMDNSNLRAVTLPDTMKTIGTMAFFHSKLERVTIKGNPTNIENSAFNWCTNLTTVNLSDEMTVIGRNMFNGCNKLSSITIPAGVKVIPYQCFNSCDSLTSIKLYNVEEIEEMAFFGCNNLKTVYLPKTLKMVGKDAFNTDAANPLTTGKRLNVYFEGSSSDWWDISFEVNNDYVTRATPSYNSKY